MLIPDKVGSTPNPVRRLAQHNGDSRGGAVRTSKERLRPWEMASIVTGFPSKIAALQFEWAWNNPHKTKKIAKEQRLTSSRESARKRIKKPRMTLMNNLKTLHLLLQVPSFSRWPLQVRFFCEDVYRRWQGWSDRVNSSIRGGIRVLLDLKQPQEIIDEAGSPKGTQARGKRRSKAIRQGGIEGLDVGYSELERHMEKSILSFAEDSALKCAVCTINVGPETAMALVCPQEHCRTVSHMACLATEFIKDRRAGVAVTPTSGRCPGCRTELQWIDLVKELSLRVRGEKVIATVTKPIERKTREAKRKIEILPQSIAHSFEVEHVVDASEDLIGANTSALDVSDESLPDNWRYQDEEDDKMSVLSGDSALSDGLEAANPTKRSSIAPKLPAVIEDSEEDEAE